MLEYEHILTYQTGLFYRDTAWIISQVYVWAAIDVETKEVLAT
jgi:hypothetical protein